MSAASEHHCQPTPGRLSPLRFIPQHWVQIIQLLAALATTVALTVTAALSLRPQSGSANSVNRLAGHFHEQQYIAICAIVKVSSLQCVRSAFITGFRLSSRLAWLMLTVGLTLCRLPLQDQPLDISFWLHYHFHMGVSKFYLVCLCTFCAEQPHQHCCGPLRSIWVAAS